MMNNEEEVMQIDLIALVRALWSKAWLILLSAVLCGALAFGYTKLFVTPLYQASVMMYVNSSTFSVADVKDSITGSDLSTAKTLINTYSVILKTRTTLNDVIDELDLSYSYNQLVSMLNAESVNGTEVFRITVTNADPKLAAQIANTIAQMLPEKISSIVEGTSARIVDMAVEPGSPVSPDTMRNAAMGALLGMVLVCALIVIRELVDDMIYDTDYLIQSYDLPILAVIPDLEGRQDKKYGYSYGYGQTGTK